MNKNRIIDKHLEEGGKIEPGTTLGARPTIMHREPIGSMTYAWLIANDVVAQSISGSATEGSLGQDILI